MNGPLEQQCKHAKYDNRSNMGDRENAEGEVVVVGEVSEARAMYEH